MRPVLAGILALIGLATPALARDAGGGDASRMPAGAAAPWRVMKGELTRAQYQHYNEVPFDLPAGVTRVTIRLTYGGREQRSVVDLGLRDPQRFRGWSGGTRDHMTLSTEDATPGYLPGPLPAGRWAVILGVPNIREGARAPYEVQVFIERQPTVTEFADAPIDARPGWYRGDLHMHSGESDGKCRAQSGAVIPCPVYRTVEAAAARRLDFIALSDHNTTAHFNALRELQEGFDRMLLVPAREVTTFWGHSNVFGPTAFVDFRMTSPTWGQARKWIDAVHDAGGAVSVSHPGAPSGEICMGCGWRVDDLPARAVDAVELVNGGTMRESGAADGTLQGFAYWTKLLNAGWHVTGIGGSDSHDADRAPSEAGAIGRPTTVIHMPELSVRGLLAGLKSGRVFIDIDGTRDRLLDLSATVGDRHATMGETLTVAAGETVRFQVEVNGVASGTVQLIVDGAARADDRVAVPATQLATIDWTADGGRHWVRAEVRDPHDRLLLVGNPVYIAGRNGR